MGCKTVGRKAGRRIACCAVCNKSLRCCGRATHPHASVECSDATIISKNVSFIIYGIKINKERAALVCPITLIAYYRMSSLPVHTIVGGWKCGNGTCLRHALSLALYYACGLPLNGFLEPKLILFEDKARQLSPPVFTVIFETCLQFLYNLQGKSSNPTSRLKGEVMDEDTILDQLEGNSKNKYDPSRSKCHAIGISLHLC
jgi:hypothetical protein